MADAKKRNGKFIGAYIDKGIKAKLQAIADQQERPLSYVIEKILSEGVKHPNNQPAWQMSAFLYKYYDKRGALLYVGVTANMTARTAVHRYFYSRICSCLA